MELRRTHGTSRSVHFRQREVLWNFYMEKLNKVKRLELWLPEQKGTVQSGTGSWPWVAPKIRNGPHRATRLTDNQPPRNNPCRAIAS